LLSRRLRFAFFVDSKWRREECARNTLPRAVILKRFATALRVLLRAIGFGIRRKDNSTRDFDNGLFSCASGGSAALHDLL
jgi:hypothetical protein